MICNLCGSNNSSEIYKNDKVRYVICGDCSLIYLNPQLTQEEYKKFYEEEYQKHRHKILTYEQAVKRREEKGDAAKQKRAKDFEGYINKDSKVLDVGCGWGTLLKVIKDKFNCRVSGIEISDLAARVAKDYYDLNVYHQTFEEYVKQNEGKEKFDFITMVQVLEHFTNPSDILKMASKIMTDDGFLYLAVPNTISPDEPLDRFFHFEHCYYFTPFTLSKLLEKNGFKIVWMDLGPRQIKIIAAKTGLAKEGIDTNKFGRLYSREKILKAIKNQDRKYKILRFFKCISEKVLPGKILITFKKFVIKILKKLKIIEV